MFDDASIVAKEALEYTANIDLTSVHGDSISIMDLLREFGGSEACEVFDWDTESELSTVPSSLFDDPNL